MDYKLNFSNNIKQYRKERGINQEELANELGYSVQTIAGWEQGKRFPDIENLIKLRDLTETSIDEMLGLKSLFEKCIDYNLEETNSGEMLFNTDTGLVNGKKLIQDDTKRLFYALGQRFVLDKCPIEIEKEYSCTNTYLDRHSPKSNLSLKFLVDIKELSFKNNCYMPSVKLLKECINSYEKQLVDNINFAKEQIKIIEDHIAYDNELESRYITDLRTDNFNIEYEEDPEIVELKDYIEALEKEYNNLIKYKDSYIN